jgi:hypothetical protein
MFGSDILPEAASRARGLQWFTAAREALGRMVMGRARAHPVAGTDMFLNGDKLSRRLRATERGAADGNANQPPSDADQLSAFEVAARDQCQHQLNRLKRRTDGELLRRKTQLNKIDVRPAGDAMRRIEKDAERAFEIYAQAENEKLVRLRSDLLGCERGLRTFLKLNRLQRIAKPLQDPLLTLGIFTAMIVLEGSFNSYVFQRVLGYGLGGGFFVAGGIAAINVCVAFSIGMYLARNCVHVDRYRRVVGFVTTILGSLVLLGALVVLAQVRANLRAPVASLEALSAAAPAAPVVTQALHLDPMHWPLESAALFLVSVIFAAAAAIHGFSGAGDRYPGYSAANRTVSDAEKAFDAALMKYRKGTIKLSAHAQDRVDDVVKAVEAQRNLFERRAVEFNSIVTVYEQNAHQIEQVFHHVIKDYREANAFVRTTFAPLYFEQFLDLDWALGEQIDPTDHLQVLDQLIDATKDEADAAKRRLHDSVETHLQQIADGLTKIDAAATTRSEQLHAVFGLGPDLEI